MDRASFLRELDVLLQDIPREERQEAMEFYEGYFEDAGPENEEAILKELVSPARAAQRIKAGLAGTPEENVTYTETGYQDQFTEQEKCQMEPRGGVRNGGQNHRHTKGWQERHGIYEETQENYSSREEAGQTAETKPVRGDNYEKNNRIGKILLLAAACILFFPVILSLAGAGFAVVVSVIAVVFSLVLVMFILTVVFGAVGLGLIVGGIVTLFLLPFKGMMMLGTGMILMGLGLLAGKVFGWLASSAFPAFIRMVVNAIGSLFHRKGEKTA